MEDNKVAVLLEDLRSQFRVFGEGLQQLNDKMDRSFEENRCEHQKIMERFSENRLEHQQLQVMIKELADDQKEIRKKIDGLDQEFEIKMRRIK
jgi:predicted nuclease with TOPRIM domain